LEEFEDENSLRRRREKKPISSKSETPFSPTNFFNNIDSIDLYELSKSFRAKNG
jgi:hypothetical protein